VRKEHRRVKNSTADPGSPHDCFAGCEAQHQQTAFAKKKQQDAAILFGTGLAVVRGGKFPTCPGVDAAAAC
jgi:hypothetical protein